MRNSPKSSFVDQEVHLLVLHFGERRVRAALAKTLNDKSVGFQDAKPRPPRESKRAGQTLNDTLAGVRVAEPEKYSILHAFLDQLKDGAILPEVLDIRQFAQQIGLKDINGKSRRDLLPKLIRFLLQQPLEKLKTDLEKARGISEQQRRRGFSVLTDKLLGDR